jgi:hypothetical protein
LQVLASGELLNACINALPLQDGFVVLFASLWYRFDGFDVHQWLKQSIGIWLAKVGTV